MPRPSETAKAAFTKLVPADPAVTVRPMFGNTAAFVNGNMFSGLFGEELFVRLSDTDAARLRREGGGDFAPMAGRPMKGYVTVPGGWAGRGTAISAWIEAALEFTRAMPAKTPKATKRSGRG